MIYQYITHDTGKIWFSVMSELWSGSGGWIWDVPFVSSSTFHIHQCLLFNLSIKTARILACLHQLCTSGSLSIFLTKLYQTVWNHSIHQWITSVATDAHLHWNELWLDHSNTHFFFGFESFHCSFGNMLILRVTVLLEAEPLPQSQASYQLVLACIWFTDLTLNLDQFPSPCCWKSLTQHNASTTMLHYRCVVFSWWWAVSAFSPKVGLFSRSV